MRTQILIVAYGGEVELDACLASLDRCAPVAVIDNSSSAGVRDVASKHGATYTDSGGNLGFAAGVNLGLRGLGESPPSYVLLLNPDAILLPAQLELLVAYLEQPERARTAVVAPQLIDERGKLQRVAWPFPTPGRAWLEAVGAGRLQGGKQFVIGACVLVRWSAISEVGTFDERFFLYAEETDWMRRALRLGWTAEVNPLVTASHRGGGMSEDDVKRETLFYAGQETYVRKWYGAGGWTIFRIGAGLGAAARAIVLPEPRRSEAKRRVMLYLRGPRNCAGISKR